MHIKEIIIDGFKSYSNKTTVSGFDQHFNAITGLNGSGKSNILDAICFVLGITSLSHVRASNLQELIYKYGNAGINKATVTIVFDNTNKKTSPLGCEDYDEVIVSRTIYQGKSKYFLNGYTATQENIKSMFQSIQLNINNPHFLIMQGKVTQVVNMKPIDILGLLEEAAGTSIYEMKKESALKTIKKKENKLEEINKILAEEISPQLEKLMKDKQNFMTWKSRENEIQRIMKILTAYDYFYLEKNITSKGDEILQLKRQEEDSRAESNHIIQQIDAMNSQVQNIENRFKNQMDKSLKETENKCKETANQLKTDKHTKDNFLKNLQNNQNEINKLEQRSEKIAISNETLERQKKDMISNLELLEKDLENKINFLKGLERNLENFITGKQNVEGEVFNLNKLITDARSNINKAKSEKETLNNQISFLENELNKKKKNVTEFKKTMNDTKKTFNNLEKEVQSVSEKINSLENSGLGSNPEINNGIMMSISQKEQELSRYESKQNEVLSQYASRVEVQFRDPEQNFNRSKVKGRIIRLFQLENERFSTALESVAGGKLFNIVVDTEQTSQILLNRKCFDYGVIMVPLNKISSQTIPENKLRLVQEIAGNEAKLAIDLIKFDREFYPAMSFAFGSTFICTTSEVAKKLAYHEHIKVKCVNLDGDVFDPAGTMSGGAIRNQESILSRVQELNYIQNNIKNIKNSIMESKNELNKCNENLNKYNELKARHETLLIQQKDMTEDSINKSLKNLENDCLKTDEEIKRIYERIKQLTELEKKYQEEEKKLDDEVKEFSSSGKQSKDVYAKKIKNSKDQISELEKNISKLKKNINDVEYCINKNSDEIKHNLENVAQEGENLETNKKEINRMEQIIKEQLDKLKKLEAELLEKKREITKNEAELNQLRSEKEKMEKKKNDIIDDLKKIETKINKYEKDLREGDDKRGKLENENKWISSEKHFFGMKDTDYDFSQLDAKSELERMNKLKEENAVLRRKVNMKVDMMADQYEKEYNDLIKKREIIIKDKNNIEKAIKELDEKRKDALEDIYSQVNRNLDSIYSTLLPGTKSRLDPPPGKTLMDGLELRVAFNNSWKKSLSELSGGQRSLLALSLILALLLYKPAPVYILDEIDAALDLSHTANLGLMIKEHFPQSQFVVVSLKDGMFNNANVLYKVSFVEGCSKVDRIVKDDGKKKLK